MNKLDPKLTITDFINELIRYRDEIEYESNGKVMSHESLNSEIRFTVKNDKSYDEYVLIGLDIDRLMGCGCWAGIEVVLEKRGG